MDINSKCKEFSIYLLNIIISFRYLNKNTLCFCGWGHKESGKIAYELSKKYQTSYVFLEDGFIRSLNISEKI